MTNAIRQSFEIRGLMLDPARQTERREFYFELLPQLARWGYNTLWWHFCDDEGFALKLGGHPEFATPFAFSRVEMRRLIAAARANGICVVPEVESLGHALSFTRLPRHAHLFDGDIIGHNAICPSHPDTLGLLEEVIREVAGLFDGPYLHAGLDEADLGACPRCRRRARGKPAWWVFAEHAKAIHRIVVSCGKRMIIWADAVENHPELLHVLPKDIVLAHWHYGEIPEERIRPSVRAGFQIVCVPCVAGMAIQPSETAVKNVEDMVGFAARLPRRNCLGVVASWWESARHLRDTYPLAAAYAGATMSSGKGGDMAIFAARFVKDHFGFADPAPARALWRLHALLPSQSETKWLYPDGLADLHEALKTAEARDCGARSAEAARCVAVLRKARRKVARHVSDYDAYLLAGRITATAHENGRRLRQAYRHYTGALDYAEYKAPRDMVAAELRRALGLLADRPRVMRELVRAVSREWDRTRHPRDGKKDGRSLLLRQRGARALLPTLIRCAAFCARWLPRFERSIRRYERGGALPGAVEAGTKGRGSAGVQAERRKRREGRSVGR
jgi:hypothetical protein